MIGLGVYDCLARDITDPETGEVYPALSCCNSQEMAARCSSVGADKVIWSIKASAQFNSDIAFMLREGFKSGRIRLLLTEYDAEDALKEIRGYESLTPFDRTMMQMPYIHTTLLIDELTKLQHEEAGGRIRIYERSGMRKDRYSSLAYNYYVANQIEAKMAKKRNTSIEPGRVFIVKPPMQNGGAVNNTHGKENKSGWEY